MKKVLLLMVFLSVYLVGNELKNSVQAQYIEALKYYKEKNFEESYRIFSKLYLSKLSDAKLNFYLGRSAYETGHYEIALASFERVEMLDKSNIRNKLEMARTYFMLKMYEESELHFQEVLNYPNIPQNVRTNIELYLSKVKKVQKKSFTYASVDLDLLYDSNVNYGSLDSTYNINTGTLPSEPERSDIAWQLYGDIVNIYDIGEKNGFAIKNRVNGMIKDYKDENNYNVKYITYMPSILYTQNKMLTEVALGIDSLTLGSHEYLRTFSVMPRFEYKHSTTMRSIVYFKYQNKRFRREEEKDLDANHYELAYGLQKILTPRSYLQGNFIALQERKKGGMRIDVDYEEYKASLNYAKQFTSIIGTEFVGEYRRRNYDDFSTLFGSTRKDNAGIIAATLNAKIWDSFRVHLKGMYNRVHSNQERFSYKKYTLSLGINKTF